MWAEDTLNAVSKSAEPRNRSRQLGTYGRWVVGATFVVAVGCLPLLPFADNYLVGVLIRILIFVALGQAWNVIAGVGGQLSLGHGVFYGLGAYTTALLFNGASITPWLGMWAGVVVSVIVAMLMGGITLRLRGIYFAIATIAVSLAFEKLAGYFAGFTGGDAGLAVHFLRDAPWAMQFGSQAEFVWLALAVVVAYYVFTRWLLTSKFGYELQAVRDDEEAAAAAGVDVYRAKLLGLAVSAAMTSIVGTLQVQSSLVIDPNSAFGLFEAILIQLPSLIGGLGTALGPIVGGTVMILFNEGTNLISTRLDATGIDVLVYGALLLTVILFAPRGLVGAFQTYWKRNTKVGKTHLVH